jgi:penicillin-binding protein 1A
MKRRKRGNTTTNIHPPFTGQTDYTEFEPSLKQAGKRTGLYVLAGLAVIIAIAASIFLYYLSEDLPALTKLERIDPALATKVYSRDNQVIASFYTINRSNTRYDQIPEHVIAALLSTEDRQFYDHWGVNLKGGLRALFVNISNFGITQGSSTLTMQLARNLYFGLERTWTRKIKEIMTAIQIERTYSKREILEMYLNINFFGSGSYGIQSAARRYYNKDVEDLTIEEGALLIGVLKGQTLYNPISNPDRALFRRNVVLESMMLNDALTRAEYDSLTKIPLNLKTSSQARATAPYFVEYVRQQVNSLQDTLEVNVYEDGLNIYTTLDSRVQHFMELSVDSLMPGLQERVRNQKHMRELREELQNDSLFMEESTLQIAFVCIDPHSGEILGLIGGRDFETSKYNRAIQAARQPGSAFKAFLYTAAIDNGYNPSDEFLDQPFVLNNPDGTRWTPENYDKTVSGWMTLREAIRRSRNLVSVRLIQEIGAGTVADYARRMGISTQIRPVSSLAMGTSEVYPMELISAYGIFANNGVLVPPVSIRRIEDRYGNILYRPAVTPREVLSPETTYIMNNLLQGVVNQGTGYGIRRDFRFFRPTGGKTGTTNDYTDAWFVGFTPDIVAGVWVGFDDPKMKLGTGMAGGVAALPFWGEFIKTTYDSTDIAKIDNFPVAANVLTIKICKETHKLVSPYCPEPVEELFNAKFQPTETCDKHSGPGSVRSKRKRGF